MKITAPQSFKLFSKIHPPLPRTQRESQQLLAVLTSSFRRQLDREHPPVQSAEPQGHAANSSKPNRTINADQHLRSILDHPLFSTVPHRPALRQTQNVQSGSSTEDPIVALDRAIASGVANINTLHDCLRRHRLQINGLPRAEMRARMKNSKIGHRIVSWFLSADDQLKAKFFRDQLALRSAMPYLVNGSHRNTLVRWLEEIRRQTPCISQLKEEFTNSPQFIILEAYVWAEYNYGDGIVPVLQFFLEACRTTTRENANGLPPYMLLIASRLVSWICSDSGAKAKNIPVQLFDDFSQIFEDAGAPSARIRTYFWKALLGLYHPINPNPDFALKHAESFSRIQPHTKRFSSGLLRLYLDAAQLCIQQEKYTQASRLMLIAKDILPDRRPSNSKDIPSEKGNQDVPSTVNDIHSSLLPT
ncbi:hypothetical protein D8B26_003166 [Coccidioides posadasii str. Silveira]|uniref:Uncharacterized protein n=3 Tax=Coccidioides posadasii TaxID=199306 RepID=E9CZ11_COCPS|nr:hypothetical protein CPC735_006270 [Coccidioides posadasii C735 delta SOWgp]EER26455.1 hypothetical protein CPC735_006270 [Coccidioides posadasii C735 delta SOWgp]EFW20455.1 conserved hypothetical protein [Coccidioides posadasii str. Silveira]KMM72976.1 hypothetical protein CPAG_09266 [Coccidioides posadasii RMSCC 3488]QVM08476.1 hypothetical protein D8B26_003166 [Coccidioides posadasii str. Silveira]|eukprot:XP_003068600.1 hypothetical protein CPC735_006270 [Coccidioides posadasii C735 delta SOWgp]